ncbi:hypothetical protein [Glycomyces sp. NRRL B-16210]|uniref:hypothetical protein n=1 Tax=Glycomyces sp. NRRL B-16210 TaxID=1463821 RepID=UPI00105EB659|nr:hypothetical protein [Glycomyces sp. NRRL B-16210]
MAVQDDSREKQMRDRFNLKIANDRTRDEIDAFLKIDGKIVNFELKSTTSGSVSTVRDFGVSHIEKWRDLHWIIAIYDKNGDSIIRCHYASPVDMAPWIESKHQYILPDIVLGNEVAAKVTSDTVIRIFGGRSGPYSREDAKWVMKKQWINAQYQDQMDLPGKYSLERMTEILQHRCAYVMARGSTLNNPHIENSFVKALPVLDEEEPAISLRQYVRSYLMSAAATEEATL